MMKLRTSFLLASIFLLTACLSPQAVIPSSTPGSSPTASSTPTEQATSSPTAAVSESTPTVGSDETDTPERLVIDMSEATLERAINPNCVDQFPITPDENGLGVVCFTFDNWVFGPVQLGDGYEMIVGAEGWYEQDGQQIPMLIPLSTVNRDKNEVWINGTLIMENSIPETHTGATSMSEILYRGNERAWTSQLHMSPGDTLYLTLGVPNEQLANNSTQGTAFEVARWTQEDLYKYLKTGAPTILGGFPWPAINIVGRTE